MVYCSIFTVSGNFVHKTANRCFLCCVYHNNKAFVVVVVYSKTMNDDPHGGDRRDDEDLLYRPSAGIGTGKSYFRICETSMSFATT
jgi:hypothetical protein